MGATGLLSKKTGHQIGHVLGVTHHVAKHYIVGQLESSRYAGLLKEAGWPLEQPHDREFEVTEMPNTQQP